MKWIRRPQLTTFQESKSSRVVRHYCSILQSSTLSLDSKVFFGAAALVLVFVSVFSTPYLDSGEVSWGSRGGKKSGDQFSTVACGMQALLA